MGVVSSLRVIDICTINTCCKGCHESVVRGHHTSKTFWTLAIGEQLTAKPPGHALINQY